MQENKFIQSLQKFIIVILKNIQIYVAIFWRQTKKYTIISMKLVMKYTVIFLKRTQKYLYDRILFKRAFAKIVDLFVTILLFLVSLLLVTSILYLAVIDLEVIFTTLLDVTIFSALVICLFLAIIYHNYFSLGRKLASLSKESSVKKCYTEPILHLNLFLIYMMISQFFFEGINIGAFMLLFLGIYVLSFLYNGGFWNKNNNITRRTS